MMSGRLLRSESTRQPTPAAIRTAARIAEWCAGFGAGGRAERASCDGHAGHCSPRPPCGGGRPEDRDEDNQREQCPRQAQPVETMVERGLQSRHDRQPDCETHDCSDQCADRADDHAVPQQHESKVLLGRADRGEHAELTEPSLRDDGEAGCGNERRQEQEDGGHREHRQRRCLLVLAPRPGRHAGGPVALGDAGGSFQEGADRVVACVDQDRDVVGCSRGRGRDECELVAQVTWVLDDADNRPAMAVEGKCLPELEPEDRCDSVGDGHLVAAFRVAASPE